MGQVLVLFDAASQYLIMTNPWGQAEESEVPSGRHLDELPEVSSLKDPMNTLVRMDAAGMFQQVRTLKKEHVPRNLKDLVEKELGRPNP